jgi:hypothetical protein
MSEDLNSVVKKVGVMACFVAFSAAAEELPWQLVIDGAIVVKNRSQPNSAIKEVWAEGDIASPLEDVQEALLDTARLKTFMPYLKESRELSEVDSSNSRYVYAVIDLPVVGKRDYIVRVWNLETSKGNSGALRTRWQAVPEYLPPRASIQRIAVNAGSWVITPTSENTCHAVYRFSVDPGGWVPAFAINLGNQQGVVETFTALEKEALKRKARRSTKTEAAQ